MQKSNEMLHTFSVSALCRQVSGTPNIDSSTARAGLSVLMQTTHWLLC